MPARYNDLVPLTEPTDLLHPLAPGLDADALAVVARRRRVLLLVLFGSTAKGTRRPNSDLDVGVLFEGCGR